MPSALAADALRAAVSGNTVSYVVNRNINYTNVCGYGCRFCAFSKGKLGDTLRGPAYDLDRAEIFRRVREAWERGATEVCMQGGIHPRYSGATYLDILATAKRAAPGIHVHAFSPLEVHHGATSSRVEHRRLPRPAARRGPRQPARHRGRNPRRRHPHRALPRQAFDRAMACHRRGGPCAGTSHHRHHHVRPHRRAAALGAPPPAHPRPAGAHRRLHRIRAAAVRTHGGADLPAGPRPQGTDVSRSRADACGGAAGAASACSEHPGVLGKARTGWRRRLPSRRRQRPRRHADERKHLARRRQRARPGVFAGADGCADRLAAPHAASAHDALRWRAAESQPRRLSGAGAAAAGYHPRRPRRAPLQRSERDGAASETHHRGARRHRQGGLRPGSALGEGRTHRPDRLALAGAGARNRRRHQQPHRRGTAPRGPTISPLRRQARSWC